MEKSSENFDGIDHLDMNQQVVGETLKFHQDIHDQGAGLFQEVQEYSTEELEAESEKVRSLIDWHIMPIVSLGLLWASMSTHLC
jgi:hypothetical protein